MIERFGYGINNCAYTDLIMKNDVYDKVFCITVENNDGTISNIIFGYSKNSISGFYIISKTPNNDSKVIEGKLYIFFEKYKSEILNGADIKTLILSDNDNILNYKVENKLLAKIRSVFEH